MPKSPDFEAGEALEAGLSRRTLLGGVAATIAAGAVFMMPLRAEAKVKPDAAKYQEQPKDGHKCSGCQQFVAPDSCKLVDGKINPEGWCQFFSPKSG